MGIYMIILAQRCGRGSEVIIRAKYFYTTELNVILIYTTLSQIKMLITIPRATTKKKLKLHNKRKQ